MTILLDGRFVRVDQRYPEYGKTMIYFDNDARVAVLVAMKSPKGNDYRP